jgi:hypothetical protein
MRTFTDDEMNALLPTAKAYSVVILRAGPNYGSDGAAPIRDGLPRRRPALSRDFTP